MQNVKAQQKLHIDDQTALFTNTDQQQYHDTFENKKWYMYQPQHMFIYTKIKKDMAQNFFVPVFYEKQCLQK